MTEPHSDTTFVAVVKASFAQLARTLIAAVAGIVLFGLVSLLTVHPLLTFLRLMSLGATALLVFSVVAMILSLHASRTVESAALLASLATSLASSLGSLWLEGSVPSGPTALAGLAAGALIGGAWSMTTFLYVDGRQIRMHGTIWSLGVWGLLMAFNQIAVIATGRPTAVMAALTLLGTGVVCGNAAGLLLRARRARALVLPTEAARGL